MCGQGCGCRVFWGAFKSPSDFPGLDSVEEGEAIWPPCSLASCSCNSSFLISSSWDSFCRWRATSDEGILVASCWSGGGVCFASCPVNGTFGVAWGREGSSAGLHFGTALGSIGPPVIKATAPSILMINSPLKAWKEPNQNLKCQ